MTYIFSLVFDYNINKLQSTGRPWADQAYKNKEFIFQYSAASIATFVHHNPHLQYNVLTDDISLLKTELLQYTKININNVNIIDAAKKISDWTSHWYCFWPLISVFDDALSTGQNVLKLDNDLTCLKPIDDLLNHDGAIVWKQERLCANGRPYWGESYAARNAFGTDNFFIWNTGTWGLTKKWHDSAREIPTLCQKMLSVDISSVARFPERPDIINKTFNTSDQVSNCFFLHKNAVPILESNEWFEHHCYGHDAKTMCISRANNLR